MNIEINVLVKLITFLFILQQPVLMCLNCKDMTKSTVLFCANFSLSEVGEASEMSQSAFWSFFGTTFLLCLCIPLLQLNRRTLMENLHTWNITPVLTETKLMLFLFKNLGFKLTLKYILHRTRTVDCVPDHLHWELIRLDLIMVNIKMSKSFDVYMGTLLFS